MHVVHVFQVNHFSEYRHNNKNVNRYQCLMHFNNFDICVISNVNNFLFNVYSRSIIYYSRIDSIQFVNISKAINCGFQEK